MSFAGNVGVALNVTGILWPNPRVYQAPTLFSRRVTKVLRYSVKNDPRMTPSRYARIHRT